MGIKVIDDGREERVAEAEKVAVIRILSLVGSMRRVGVTVNPQSLSRRQVQDFIRDVRYYLDAAELR